MNINMDTKVDSSELYADRIKLEQDIEELVHKFFEKHYYVKAIKAEAEIGIQFNNNNTFDKWINSINLNVTI